MCLTVPGRVTAIDQLGATVEVGQQVRRATTIFTPDVSVGDWVIVSAGSVLRILDPAEAEMIRATLLDAIALEDAELAVRRAR